MRITIGTFRPSKDGGWEGRIETLTIDRKVRLVPTDDRVSDTAPDFRLMLGWKRIGYAWEEKTKVGQLRDYLRVLIEDPCLPRARHAALFPDADGANAQLIWDSTFP